MNASQSVSAGASRHGILPVRYRQSWKSLANRCRILEDTQCEFSSRRGWQALVRIWLKIDLIGDEIIELIEGIEVPPGGHPSEVEPSPRPETDIRWVEKAPIKLYQLKAIVETGIRFAADSVSIKARDMQYRQLSYRLPALERMRSYYRQLAEDAFGGDSKESDAIHAEYQRRLHEEIHFARVKAKLNLIALETISTPVQQLKWVLWRKAQTEEVVAVVDLCSGRAVTTVRCDFCGNQISTFGLSESNQLICIDCRYGCDPSGQHSTRYPDEGGISQSCQKSNYQIPLFQDR